VQARDITAVTSPLLRTLRRIRLSVNRLMGMELCCVHVTIVACSAIFLRLSPKCGVKGLLFFGQ
jgi:hypothetical protein